LKSPRKASGELAKSEAAVDLSAVLTRGNHGRSRQMTRVPKYYSPFDRTTTAEKSRPFFTFGGGAGCLSGIA
jgi:hypothetical protein